MLPKSVQRAGGKQNDPKQASPQDSASTNLENEPLGLMTENLNFNKTVKTKTIHMLCLGCKY